MKYFKLYYGLLKIGFEHTCAIDDVFSFGTFSLPEFYNSGLDSSYYYSYHLRLFAEKEGLIRFFRNTVTISSRGHFNKISSSCSFDEFLQACSDSSKNKILFNFDIFRNIE